MVRVREFVSVDSLVATERLEWDFNFWRELRKAVVGVRTMRFVAAAIMLIVPLFMHDFC